MWQLAHKEFKVSGGANFTTHNRKPHHLPNICPFKHGLHFEKGMCDEIEGVGIVSNKGVSVVLVVDKNCSYWISKIDFNIV